ncbi:MAG: hypothetical protein RIM23_05850 [Coleofasciculus sp. G3-WIS-01]
MPKLKFVTSGAGGRIPKGNKLKRQVEKLLSGKDAYDAVIALTDVYTDIAIAIAVRTHHLCRDALLKRLYNSSFVLIDVSTAILKGLEILKMQKMLRKK